jgi:hypothetical protein
LCWGQDASKKLTIGIGNPLRARNAAAAVAAGAAAAAAAAAAADSRSAISFATIFSIAISAFFIYRTQADCKAVIDSFRFTDPSENCRASPPAKKALMHDFSASTGTPGYLTERIAV